eukprot:COSAG02_NODE_680_length_18551_cov_16.648060_5_plen_116_part_00
MAGVYSHTTPRIRLYSTPSVAAAMRSSAQFPATFLPLAVVVVVHHEAAAAAAGGGALALAPPSLLHELVASAAVPAPPPADVNARFDCPESSCWCGEVFKNYTIRHIPAQYALIH